MRNSLPRLTVPKPVDARRERVAACLDRARGSVATGGRFAKFLRRWIHGHNDPLSDVFSLVALLTKVNESLINRVDHLSLCVGFQDQSLSVLATAAKCDAEVLSVATDSIDGHRAELGDLRKRINHLFSGARALDDRLRGVAGDIAPISRAVTELRSQVQDCIGRTSTLAEEWRLELEPIVKNVTGLETQLRQSIGHVSVLREELSGIATHVMEVQNRTDRLQLETKNFASETQPAINEVANFKAQSQELSTQLSHLKRQIDRLSVSILTSDIDNTSPILEFPAINPKG